MIGKKKGIGRPWNGWKKADGCTLVESMVALVVLSIGVIGGMGMCEWAEQGLQRGVLANRA